MTELVILRHAKAQSDADEDFKRSLTGEGWKQAEASANALAEARFHVGRVLCSPALRARETLIPLRGPLNIREADIVYDRNLYNASAETVADIVVEHLAAAPLLVVGHNPGLEQFVSWLSGATLPLGTGNWVRLQLAGELVEGGAEIVGRFRGDSAS